MTGNEPEVNEVRQHCAQSHRRRLSNQSRHADQRATEEHPTPAPFSFAVEEGENTQDEKKRRENLRIRGECVTRSVGMDEHGIANPTPCSRPIVPDSRANPP